MIQLDCLILDIIAPNWSRKAGDYLTDFREKDYIGISCSVEGEPVYIVGGSPYSVGKGEIEIDYVPIDVYIEGFEEPLRVTNQTLIATTKEKVDVLRKVDWVKVDDLTDKHYIVVPALVKKGNHTLWMVAYKKVSNKKKAFLDKWITNKKHLMRLALKNNKRSFATPMGFLHV